MADILMFLIIGIFLALLFLNIYFRVKVLRRYKALVQNNVVFDSSHFFNKKKLEAEVLAKYPASRSDIEIFILHIKRSLLIAVVLVFLITLMGFILKNV